MRTSTPCLMRVAPVAGLNSHSYRSDYISMLSVGYLCRSRLIHDLLVATVDRTISTGLDCPVK